MHFDVPMGFQDFATHFLDEVLFQNVAHIDDFPLLGDPQVAFILSSCVAHRPSYPTRTIFYLFFFPIFFGKFQQENYISMCGHYGSRILGVFARSFNEMSSSTTGILWWFRPSLYGGLCPIYFSRELGFGGFVFVL